MPQQQLSPAQFALLRSLFIQGGDGTVPGTWIEDGTLPTKKIDLNIVTTAIDLTATEDHDIIKVDSSAGAVVITLPLLEGKIIQVKFESGGNNVSVDSSILIDGEASVALYLQESLTMVCDAVTWSII